MQASAIESGVKAALDQHLSSSVFVEHVASLVGAVNPTVSPQRSHVAPRAAVARVAARGPGLFGSSIASQTSQTSRGTAAVTADVTLLATTAVGSIVNV